jgi:hypothetical protein
MNQLALISRPISLPALIAVAGDTEVAWFAVDPDNAMREAAGEILDWLDHNQIPHEWLGRGKWKNGKFKVAISFQKPEHVTWAILKWP